MFEYTSCDQQVLWVAKAGALFTAFHHAQKNPASPFQVSLLKDASST
jgi:hypothetical protein